jgi:DNA mismatch repair ATPase MutS
LFSLVDMLKTSEAKLSAQAEAHKAEVEDLKKKLAEMNEKFEVANAKHEISEIARLMVQKNVEELHDSKERCYEISLKCAKTLKNSFTKVGAYSSEKKFIRDDPDGKDKKCANLQAIVSKVVHKLVLCHISNVFRTTTNILWSGKRSPAFMKLLKTTTSLALGRGMVLPPDPQYRNIMKIFVVHLFNLPLFDS